MYHYDLYIHQYVNSAFPHSVFQHLDCPILPYSESGSFNAVQTASSDKGQQIIPVSLPLHRTGEEGLTVEQWLGLEGRRQC